jgi:hypothetical protein
LNDEFNLIHQKLKEIDTKLQQQQNANLIVKTTNTLAGKIRLRQRVLND